MPRILKILHGVLMPLRNRCLVPPSCRTLCDPTDCSAPGLPVLRHLPECAHTPVCRVHDAIQSSHPLLAPSPLALENNDRELGRSSRLHDWIVFT